MLTHECVSIQNSLDKRKSSVFFSHQLLIKPFISRDNDRKIHIYTPSRPVKGLCSAWQTHFHLQHPGGWPSVGGRPQGAQPLPAGRCSAEQRRLERNPGQLFHTPSPNAPRFLPCSFPPPFRTLQVLRADALLSTLN